MFCALKGATRTPRRRSHAQIAVVIQLLPTWDAVPPTNSERGCRECTVLPRNVPNEVVAGTGLLTCGEFPPTGLPARVRTVAEPSSWPLTVAGQWRACTAFPSIPADRTATYDASRRGGAGRGSVVLRDGYRLRLRSSMSTVCRVGSMAERAELIRLASALRDFACSRRPVASSACEYSRAS